MSRRFRSTSRDRPPRPASRAPLAACFVAALALGPTAQAPNLAPFVATPPDVVDRMLRLAGTGPADVVYDLGSGDGRIVIAAARDFGARAVGVEINPGLVATARAAARAAGVDARVEFRLQDALTVDLREATVVTLYLLSASNVKLRPILMNGLRPGARIVSHDFAMGDWEPDAVETFRDAGGVTRTLYRWDVGQRHR